MFVLKNLIEANHEILFGINLEGLLVFTILILVFDYAIYKKNFFYYFEPDKVFFIDFWILKTMPQVKFHKLKIINIYYYFIIVYGKFFILEKLYLNLLWL